MALTEPQEVTTGRPTCCEYAAGRVFYGFRNTVYFSQVLEGNSLSGLNKCYQRNDPTSDQISDLLATDGGTVQVDDAVNINQIRKFRNGVLVYAQNGVWLLSGGDGGFDATNYGVTQVTTAGCSSPKSVVVADDKHMYWSREGIFVIGTDEFNNPRAQSLTEGTIQSFYNDIPLDCKNKAVGRYNTIKKQVEWLYASIDTSGIAEAYKYGYDRGLLYDMRSSGWWPQEYDVTISRPDDLYSVSNIYGIENTTLGTQDGETVFLNLDIVLNKSLPPTMGSEDLSIGTKTDETFVDFGSDNNYNLAYIETGYETLGKPSNKKIAPYTTVHMLQTEQNWIDDGAGGLTLDNPSSCTMRSKWDWNNSSANGRWSPEQQVYRMRRINIPDAAGAFDSGEQVITTRNKILGRGNALQLRFEQSPQKDMQILGYTTTYSVKGKM